MRIVQARYWLATAAALSVAVATAQGRASAGILDRWADDALEQSQSTAASIADFYRRAHVLANIAEMAAAVRDTRRADRAINDALTAAAQIQVNPFKAWALHDIAMAQLKTEDPIGARELVDRIDLDGSRDPLLVKLAELKLGAGDNAGALELVGKIRGAEPKGEILRTVALRELAQGNTKAAIATAEKIADPFYQAAALADIAASYASAGQMRQAQGLVGRVRNRADRAQVLLRIAVAQEARDGIVPALKTAEQIADPWQRALVLAAFAEQQADRKDVATARKLAESASVAMAEIKTAPDRRALVLFKISQAQQKAGDTAQARESRQRAVQEALQIKNESRKGDVLGVIARAQAKSGDVADAREAALQIQDAVTRDFLIRDLSSMQTQAGNLPIAMAMVESAQDAQAKASALFGIVDVQVTAGDFRQAHQTIDAALPIVRAATDPQFRAGGLASLAAAQVRSNADATATFAEAIKTAREVADDYSRALCFIRISEALRSRAD